MAGTKIDKYVLIKKESFDRIMQSNPQMQATAQNEAKTATHGNKTGLVITDAPATHVYSVSRPPPGQPVLLDDGDDQTDRANVNNGQEETASSWTQTWQHVFL